MHLKHGHILIGQHKGFELNQPTSVKIENVRTQAVLENFPTFYYIGSYFTRGKYKQLGSS